MSTAPPKTQPCPSRNRAPVSAWAAVRVLVVIRRPKPGERARRPSRSPSASSMRPKRSQSPAVPARPPAPAGEAGGGLPRPSGVDARTSAPGAGARVVGVEPAVAVGLVVGREAVAPVGLDDEPGIAHPERLEPPLAER